MDVKTIRKQLRNVVQEELKNVLSAEIAATVERKLMAIITERLDKIDQRQKEITSYIVRNGKN